MNFMQVAGHLGADPEERFTPSGQKVITLRLATQSRKAGKDETIWWKATIWGDRFDKMIPYLKKGSPLIVMGEMNKPTIYNGKDGSPQISLEIVVSDMRFSPFGRSEKPAGQEGKGAQAAQNSAYANHSADAVNELSEDEIPF